MAAKKKAKTRKITTKRKTANKMSRAVESTSIYTLAKDYDRAKREYHKVGKELFKAKKGSKKRNQLAREYHLSKSEYHAVGDELHAKRGQRKRK